MSYYPYVRDEAQRARCATVTSSAADTGSLTLGGPPASTRRVTSWRAIRAHPALVLSGLIVLSVLYRYAAARATVAPAIFPDELVYMDLARDLGHGGSLPPLSFGPLYPIVLAPVFAIVHDSTTAYAAVKAVNCVLVSLSAVPAYLLARRLVQQRAALLFAATVLLVPSLVYSTRVMTESLAYPLFLWAVLAIQRTIERPTGRRQVTALALIGLAVLARPQMIVLIPAFVCAVVAAEVLATTDEDGRSLLERLRAYGLVWAAPGALAVSALAAWAAGLLTEGTLRRGDVSAAHVQLLSVPRLFVYHLAEIDLASGVIPLAAFLLLTAVAHLLPRTLRAFVATTSSVGILLLLLAATYTSQMPQTRIYERYVLYLTPLLVLALLGWIEQGLPRPRGTRVYVAISVLLPLLIPFDVVLTPGEWGVSTSTVGLVPWALMHLATPSLVPIYAVIAVLSAGCALLLLTARAGAARRLMTTVIFYFLVVGLLVHAANVALALRSARAGTARLDRVWIDRMVGDARVAAIWTGTAKSGWRSGYGIWENMFFNRSVQTVYTVRGEFRKWGSTPLALRGTLATAHGAPVSPRYVLADPTARVDGTVIGHDRCTGMTLYRTQGPLHIRIKPPRAPERTPEDCRSAHP